MNTTLTPADLDPRRQAMLLYFQGYRVARIAEMLGEKVATVHSWKKRDKWGDYGPLDQMQLTTAARYCQLIMKEHKEGKDFKEIDLLARQSERHARIGKFNNGGNEADFPLSELQACMVDSWEVWTDFHALALRPFGWREVWIGYDPAKGTQNGDSAGCVVVAPPAVPGGKFRILERHQWRGMDFRAQADAIKKLTEQYNVTYIGIDSTGVGHGVYENVKAFFPAVREFVYNPNVKNALVLKAYDIISHRRLEFDAGHTDIAQSFMAIRRATTASGNRPTYEASRSEEASHADLAWATMHALFNEPLQGESANTSNIVEIF